LNLHHKNNASGLVKVPCAQPLHSAKGNPVFAEIGEAPSAANLTMRYRWVIHLAHPVQNGDFRYDQPKQHPTTDEVKPR